MQSKRRIGECTDILGSNKSAQNGSFDQPVTGHPQVTHTTAAKISWDVCCLRMQAAAQVSMYMAKLLGKRLVADVNIPQEKRSNTRSLLLMDTPA